MIETTLMQYGILGLWTITLLAKDLKFNKDLRQTISNNTTALNKLSTMIEIKRV